MAFDGTLKFDTAIDKTGFKVGIGQLGNLAKAGMGVVSAAVTAASTAVSALGGYAVNVGKNFESSMAQVIATMGITEDTIQDGINSYELLKNAAAKAGETTTFSASEAADALNYLALAGYSAEKAAGALPAVLDLAAAGGIDLAYASDLATDAMAALGIEATSENLTHFGDQMAKTASKANTSVAQLGEAILTVGGTAKSLAGGTSELNAALGVLANRGIKGSEGGTALRNLILSLSSPTDKAAAAMENLGLKVFDAEGNMRPLNEVFRDLNLVLADMNEGEKTKALDAIFNKVDLKSAQAMLAGCGDEFDTLTNALSDCDGAMAQMAVTMNDTLAGDIKSLQSKAEAFGITMYESLNEPFRELVQLGGEYVSQLTNAFKDGGFEGLAGSLGDVLGNAVAKLTLYLPEIAELGASVITQMVEGIRKNNKQLSSAASGIMTLLAHTALDLAPDLLAVGMELIVSLAEGFAEEAPDLLTAAETGLKETAGIFMEHLPEFARAGMSIISTIGSAVLENLPELVSAAVTAISEFCDTLLTPENLELLLQSGYMILTTVMDAVTENLPELIDTAISLIMFLTKELLSPDNVLMLIETAAELLVTIVDAIADNADELFLAAEEIVRTLCDELTSPENLSEFVRIATELVAELIVGLCDLAGKFLGFAALLNEEVSTSVEEIDWAEIGIAIVEGICSGLLGCDFELDKYLEDFGENWVSGIKDIFGIHSPSKLMEDSVGKYLALGIGEGFSAEAAQIGEDIMQAVTEWTALLPTEAQAAAEDFLKNTDDLFTELPVQMAEHLEDTISEAIAFGKDLAERGRTAASGMAANIMDIASDLPDKLASVGRNLVEGLWNGITGMGSWLKSQISGFADSVLSGFTEAFGIHSPSTVMRDYVGRFLAQGIGVGFTEEIPQIGEDAVRAFTDLELPEMTVGAKLPDNVDAGAVQALRSMRTDTGIAAPSPTSSIVNNYSYSTVNHNAPQADAESPVINLYATFEMDGEAVAEGAAERIDEKQGAKINLKTRGVSI